MKGIFKKILSISLLSIFLFVSYPTGIFAQEELLFGQEHYYSVMFRGNGEAIVYAKIEIENRNQKSPLRYFTFEIPEVTPSEIIIYQTPSSSGYYYDDYDYYSPSSYYQEYPYRYNNQYTQLEYSKSGQLYKVEFASPVSVNSSTTVIIAYAAMGYVKNTLGVFKYEFETLKVQSRISSTRVSVDVDSELFLKGKKSEVNYQSNAPSSWMLSSMEGDKSFTSSELDSISSRIGSYGKVTKQAQNLAPNESLSVKGSYSSSWFKLYAGSIFTVLAIIAGIFLGIIYLTKYLKKRSETKKEIERVIEEQNKKKEKGNGKDNIIKEEVKVEKKKETLMFFAPIHVGLGLVSTISTAGLSILLQFLSSSGILSDFFYGYGYFEYVGYISMLIMVVLMYMFLIFGPAIIIAVKHGWKSFLAVMVAEFLWFIFFLIVIGVIVIPLIFPIRQYYM